MANGGGLLTLPKIDFLRVDVAALNVFAYPDGLGAKVDPTWEEEKWSGGLARTPWSGPYPWLPNTSSSYPFQELSAFPREVGGSGAGLHPVVYPCTALLLLCLFSTIITYILNHRWELLKEGGTWREGFGSH